MLSASEAASELSLLKDILSLFAPVYLLLCFVQSVLHLVQTQNDCYKVSSTASWLSYCCWHSLLDGMFHNKEREMTSGILLH